MKSYKNFINNRFVPTAEGSAIAVTNPADETLAGEVAAATVEQVIEAVEAAANAQSAWKKLPGVERGQYLHRLADALEKRADDIGQALALESGKSLADARSEAMYSAENVRYQAEWGRRLEGEIIPSDSPDENLLLFREPIGVVVCLIPFNYPVYTLLRKIAPALIAGNTVVVRPSNNTPMSAFEVVHAVEEAGFPPGVINILSMAHAEAEVLCTHPKVGMITLTGSVNAGRRVLEYSKSHIAKTSLELGGKTPAIVAMDADLQKAAREIVASKVTNCGQLCTAVERVYVDARIHDDFLALLKQQMAEKTYGDRAIDPAHMGPLISQSARMHIHALVQRAVQEGARVELGGTLPAGRGYFYPPTLLSACQQTMEIVREEIFGPVLCVLPFQHLDEALSLTNDHQFGLSSVLYTNQYAEVMKFANGIEAGELYVNRTPADPYQGFHAGWKASGLGGDDGKHGMLEFTQTRLVVMKY